MEVRRKQWNIQEHGKKFGHKRSNGGNERRYTDFDGWEKSTADMEETASRIKKELDIQPTDRVLEVGCGAGGLAQYMDCEYVGIDFSKTLVSRCMEFFQKSAIYSEANDIPFKDKYFDKCFSWGVFYIFQRKSM